MKNNHKMVRFEHLFNVISGVITPKYVVSINGNLLKPGETYGTGVCYGGVNLSQYIGKEIEVEREEDVFVIRGPYDK